jgi:O-acetyl-ADP-ribose deacetylase (regulator of RNase III)
MMSTLQIGTATIELVQGDITQQDVDAIVNAANSALAGGGGVDGAIHRVGGPSIMEECGKLGGCPTGQAKITGGGNLKARFVIHAVGPIYYDGTRGEPELLTSAYRNSLEVAREHKLRSVAFPSLSIGAYRYPLKDAAKIALETTIDYLQEYSDEFDLVRFVLFGDEAMHAFGTELEKLRSKLQQ